VDRTATRSAKPGWRRIWAVPFEPFSLFSLVEVGNKLGNQDELTVGGMNLVGWRRRLRWVREPSGRLFVGATRRGNVVYSGASAS